MPELLHEFDLYADLAPDDVGEVPTGHRFVVNVTGGKAEGTRIRGAMTGSGADWLLLGPDGFGRLDVRFTLRTDDNALIYFQYYGLLELTPPVMAILGGGGTPTDYGDQYFFTNPRLETGDERYGWVNRTTFVGQGRVTPGPAVQYRVYQVSNS